MDINLEDKKYPKLEFSREKYCDTCHKIFLTYTVEGQQYCGDCHEKRVEDIKNQSNLRRQINYLKKIST